MVEIAIKELGYKFDDNALTGLPVLEKKYHELAQLRFRLRQSQWDELVEKCKQREALATALFEKVDISTEDGKLEWQNGLKAADYMRSHKIITTENIKATQGLLLEGLNEIRPASEQKVTGDWKKVPNHIKGRECAPVERVPELMEVYVEWFNGDAKNLHPIVAAWAAQYIFVDIHPLEDGNGRTSRIAAQKALDDMGGGKFYGFGVVSLSTGVNDNRTGVLRVLDDVQDSPNGKDITKFLNFMIYCQGYAVDLAITEAKEMLPHAAITR